MGAVRPEQALVETHLLKAERHAPDRAQEAQRAAQLSVALLARTHQYGRRLPHRDRRAERHEQPMMDVVNSSLTSTAGFA
jgi:hypothetical protein